MMDKLTIYTIGYTSFCSRNGVDTMLMLQTLKECRINFLVDVRSVPYSRQFPECNANVMKMQSPRYGITYMHMPELGAKASEQQDVFSVASDIFFDDIFPIPKSNRPEKTELQSYDEIVDFNKFRSDEIFISGLKRIETAYDKGYTLALMCSEKNPMDCHRYFLISRSLEERYGDWLKVVHITLSPSGEICYLSNEELNDQLEKHVLSKKDVKKLNISYNDNSLFSEFSPLDNYFGETPKDKIRDFSFRYWNLMHGWKKIYTSNNSEFYD